ncbi:MAG: 1-acyl-sn-glycerol-3-phosphate acyltransferase [Desulfobacterales bacterium]
MPTIFLKHFFFRILTRAGLFRKNCCPATRSPAFLVEEKGFYRRFVKSRTDPLHYLIEMQHHTDKPIIFLPHLMFFSKTPRTTQLTSWICAFRHQRTPAGSGGFSMCLKTQKIFIETSDPVILKGFFRPTGNFKIKPQGPGSGPSAVSFTQINRHCQTITGPILKSRLEIQEEMLTNRQVQDIITDYAVAENISIHQAHRQAVDFLDEIAANYNPKMIRLFDITLRWMFKNIFEGMVIDYKGLDRVKRVSKKGPLILVPCHKSHLDYLILSYVFFNNNMPCPLIAAGKNLSFWPLGPIFRGGGAFFLRRTFKGERLYPKIFASYIKKVLEEGFHIEFFVEGGRSRTGKLLAPKIGLLSLLIDAFIKNEWEDMTFVPIYIGYDRVLEESAYINEIEGGKKAPENLKNVIKARKFLKKKYGKIYLNFNEPFSLNDYLSHYERKFSAPASSETKPCTMNLAKNSSVPSTQVSMVTPHAVIASAILNCGQKRFDYNQLMAHVETYLTYLFSQNINLADTLILDHTKAFNQVLNAFVHNKVIEKTTSEFSKSAVANPLFKTIEARRPALEYYKNNGIIAFRAAAFTALAILKADAFQFSSVDVHVSYKFLQEFFENNCYGPDQPVEFLVRKNLKAFIDDAIIMPHPTLPDTYNLTSIGYRKLNLFAAFLVPYFESYWIVLNFYRKYTKKSIFETKDYMKKIQSLGNRMHRRKGEWIGKKPCPR